MIKFQNLIEYEDADYILINKPYDVSTLEDRDGTKTNILKLAKSYSHDAQVCHRLDKETSGILIIAKNPPAYRHMSLQFENREIIKIYHAIVSANQRLDNQMVDLPITAMSDGIVKIDKVAGKQASTIFNTLQVYNRQSLVACFPITGRMHQIRIHLVSLQCPIVGDIQYGGKNIFLSDLKKNFKLKKDTEEQPLIKRVALHARSVTFKDMSGKEVSVEAKYPKDFAVLVRQLEINA